MALLLGLLPVVLGREKEEGGEREGRGRGGGEREGEGRRGEVEEGRGRNEGGRGEGMTETDRDLHT